MIFKAEPNKICQHYQQMQEKSYEQRKREQEIADNRIKRRAKKAKKKQKAKEAKVNFWRSAAPERRERNKDFKRIMSNSNI